MNNYFLVMFLLVAQSLNAQICKPESIPATTPTNRFIVHANGTVTDKTTGLMWKKCSEGQSGDDCGTGSPSRYNWGQALQQAQEINDSGGFAGYRDWRLPNIKELYSIVENQCLYPAINLDVFPNTPYYNYTSEYHYDGHHSSSPSTTFNGFDNVYNDFHSVSFEDGEIEILGFYFGRHLRLVRGGQ